MTQLKNIIRCLRLVFKKRTGFAIVTIINVIFGIAICFLTVAIVDQIFVFYNGGKSVQETVILIVVTIAIITFIRIFNLFHYMLKDRASRDFKHQMSKVFYSKLNDIDYEVFQSPDFLNHYQRALNVSVDNIFRCAMNFVDLIAFTLRILTIFSIFSFVSIYTIFVGIFIGIIFIIINYLNSKYNFKLRNDIMPLDRKFAYLRRTYLLKNSIVDLKTSDIDLLLNEMNDEMFDDYIKSYHKRTLPQVFLNFILEIFSFAMYPILLLVILLTKDGSNLTTGNVASLTVSASLLASYIKSITSSIGGVQNCSLEVKVPFELLDSYGKIEGVKGKDEAKSFESLNVEHVSFGYDDKYILKDINLSIKKGQKIAIVGSNGAGKTTLVKLLLRLYDANEGTISYNGINYKDLDPKSLRLKVGAVFQNCEVYATTLKENILLYKPTTEEDYQKLNDAIKFSGLDSYIKTLPNGVDTEITREFSGLGVVLSGGLTQRLAIARGYVQNYDLFILDEPSSALDPLAEGSIYDNLLSLNKDKTLIFISHRLTTTVNADVIYLFDDGKIIESGTHEELLKQNGMYALMFNSQASKYLGGEEDE